MRLGSLTVDRCAGIGRFCRSLLLLLATAAAVHAEESPQFIVAQNLASQDVDLPPAPAVAEPTDVFTNLSPMEQQQLRDLVRRYVDEREAERASPPPVDDPHSMKASWKHGLSLQTKDKSYSVNIGGRTQFDTSWYGVPQDIQQDPTLINQYGDGVDFRRVRLKIDGTMHEFIEWACQVDFVNSVRNGTNNQLVPAPTDLWWAFKDLPYLGTIKVGNQKEPIGFEHLVSSRYLPFMERSFNQDSFYGGFNNGFTPGITVGNTAFEESATWAVGAFKPTINAFAFSVNSGDFAATSRLTYLLHYDCDGEELVHLGFSARHASSFDGTLRVRARSPIRSGISSVWPIPSDTGTFLADTGEMLNGELAAVYGSWTFQSDCLAQIVTRAELTSGAPVGTAFFYGGYAQLFYYLTGEHDHYNRKSAVFERVIPNENARRSGFLCPLFCGGAWQVGLRYSYLDLNSNGIAGSVLNDVTAGLNWFLNPNMKLQWNYSATHRESGSGIGDGWIHGFGIRVAHDF